MGEGKCEGGSREWGCGKKNSGGCGEQHERTSGDSKMGREE